MREYKRVYDQKGSSMIEMLGVLTIIGMVGMGSIKIISNVYNLFIQNMIVTEARDLQKTLSDRYRFEGNYTSELFKNKECDKEGVDEVAQFICNNKMAPFQMCSGGKLHHRGGGDVKICEHNDKNKYYMTFYNLTNNSCAALAQVNWYTRQKSDVYQMSIYDGAASGDDIEPFVVDSSYSRNEATTNTFPISTIQALGACNHQDNNVIQLTFF